MKLLLVLFFVLGSITSYSKTSIGPKDELKALVDNLNYTLTVEWDQKDKSFYDSAITTFNHDLAKLKSEGLKINDILDLAIDLAQDSSTKDQLIALGQESNLLSNEDIGFKIRSMVEKSYYRGASWDERHSNQMILAIPLFVFFILPTISIFAN